MRNKLLIALAFLLVSTIIVSCGTMDISKNIEVEPIIEEKVTDESLISPAHETEKYVDLQRLEGDETDKDEPADKNENDETNSKDELNGSDTDSGLNEDILECTLSVTCNNILKNITKLNKEKLAILPQDGTIFSESRVIFYDGESAFNVLARELKKNGIHIDFVNSPMYNTVYIRGISNLYEHDCGELSGWMYIVNGKTPNIGCSQYILKNGDKIEFVYTCDLGRDIGL